MSRRDVSDLDWGAKATMVVVPPATADLVPVEESTPVDQKWNGFHTCLEIVGASALTAKQGRLLEMDMTIYATWLRG